MFKLENLKLNTVELLALEKSIAEWPTGVELDITPLNEAYYNVSIEFGTLEDLFRISYMAGIYSQRKHTID